jgi:hypothetical protein
MVELHDEQLEAIAGGAEALAVQQAQLASFFTGTCGRVCKALTPQFGCTLTSG